MRNFMVLLSALFLAGCEQNSVSANPENLDELTERLDALTERVDFLESQIIYTFEFDYTASFDLVEFECGVETIKVVKTGITVPAGEEDYIILADTFGDSDFPQTHNWGLQQVAWLSDVTSLCQQDDNGYTVAIANTAVVEGEIYLRYMEAEPNVKGFMFVPVNPS